jgi:hypothetical protein
MSTNPHDEWDFDDVIPSGTYARWENPLDEVIGRIAQFGLEDGTTYDGEPCPLIVLETVDGIVRVTGSYTTLRNALTAQQHKAIPGYGARITYVGDKTSNRTGKDYKEFAVVFTREPVAPIVPTSTPAAAADEAPF